MKPDQAPEGGKFRATAASALDGVAGAWGDGDMLCVKFDATGRLEVAGAADNCIGVIWTSEGRKDLGLAADKQVVGGRKYTVFTFAEFVEADTASAPALAEGNELYATAAGDVNITKAAAGAGDIYVGAVLNGGSRLLINVNGRPIKA